MPDAFVRYGVSARARFTLRERTCMISATFWTVILSATGPFGPSVSFPGSGPFGPMPVSSDLSMSAAAMAARWEIVMCLRLRFSAIT